MKANHLEFLRKKLREKHGPDMGDVLFGEAIKNLKINRFLADCTDDERASRAFGKFKHLVGLILKSYDANKHKLEKPFEVPPDWPVTAGIDWHLNKPQAISFYAVDPRQMHYVIHEIWQHLSAEEVADWIIRMKIKHSWRLKLAFIDPLAKGDDKFVKNRMGNVKDSFSIIRKRLAPYEIRLEPASKDKIASGIPNVQSWLKGPNGLPILYFFPHLERHFYEIARWVYDENGEPKKEFDDFMENLYRYTLFNIKYVEPDTFTKKITIPNRSIA